jgi:hypothetical protein
MSRFAEMLKEQRWDDHRYYHHNRVNQSLHVFSSSLFLCAYVLLFVHPVAAAILAWPVAMLSRQVGHFFFEPKDYDQVNQASHDYKESVKVGYNLHRKVILLSLWASTPFLLVLVPGLFGVFTPHRNSYEFLENLARLWIALGIGAVLFRTVHLFFLKDVKTGIVWFTKIVTDPFHDIYLYHRAPLQVLRGELYDPAGPRRQHV